MEYAKMMLIRMAAIAKVPVFPDQDVNTVMTYYLISMSMCICIIVLLSLVMISSYDVVLNDFIIELNKIHFY